MKATTTAMLRDLYAVARVEYPVSVAHLASLDPKGIHTLSDEGFWYPGERNPQVWRGRVFLKLVGQEGYTVVYGDVPRGFFMELPDAYDITVFKREADDNGDNLT